jgi:hypothetical protein
MKNKNTKPTRSDFNILRQICNSIPPPEVAKIARATGAEDKSRRFDPWSHAVSLLYGQLTQSIGLNDLCNSLQLHSGPLSTLRGATAPSQSLGATAPARSNEYGVRVCHHPERKFSQNPPKRVPLLDAAALLQT